MNCFPIAPRRAARTGRLALLLSCLLLAAGLRPAQASTPPAAPPAATAGPSLSTVLNPDGTLRAGASGSFDAKGYQLLTAPDGRPVFQPAQASKLTGVGDEKWRDGFGLPSANGAVLVMAVAANGDLYIGGTFTVVGTATANNVAILVTKSNAN